MQNNYPIWKNVGLAILLLLGIIYAIPNLFGDDPSLQISMGGRNELHANAIAEIKTILAKHQIEYLELEAQKDGLLVRFKDPELQLKARDALKARLSEEYLIALNLAPRTPHWLQALGAHPMKLGLDLRGGVHFLLKVDLDDMIRKREDGEVRAIAQELRTHNIRYLSVQHTPANGIVVLFRDAQSLDRGVDELSHKFQDYKFSKLSTNGEYRLQILVSENAIAKVADYAIEQTVNILRNRVNELGVSEAIVQRQGQQHVSVDLPGIQDTVHAKELIGKTATLRFQLVDMEHDLDANLSGSTPLGTKIYDYEKGKVLLKEQVVLTGNSITYAAADIAQDGTPAVNVRLGGGGESLFNRITAENVGNALAVVYVENKSESHEINGKIETISRPVERVISVATIGSALGNNFQITGLVNDKYAQDLALLLRSGALVAPVSIVQETTVGPSMGKANINKGVLSIVVGYALVMIFMGLYYRWFGMISNLALLCNLVFMMAILSILGATLTLPGMAGMVLTVGMAVDASILIYERIREELRSGSSLQASIYHGYQRAFATIIDANVATLIVAMVLFALGTGAVKGFAVTLTIGLMTSMLTSIVFTRAVINLVYGGKRRVKHLSIGV